ncbi:aspartate kinase [Pyrococcus sp. ST04]|uniref:aspartate kinase n=1 Tax=Pyrococcus sp. ST04 TaxID=1183377 RepID=UPI0002605E64|nr:aspartate kinase [Pyrococcus sp. ST04]AFK22584.1 aspartate kinase [Pyrococcus sp. ST04]
MIVIKFGGSSIRSEFREAVDLTLNIFDEEDVIVVVSALKGITDKLIKYSETLDPRIAVNIAAEYVHFARLHGIDPSFLKPYLDELFHLPELRGNAFQDYILGIGEVLSAVLFAAAVNGVFVPAWEVFRGEGEFGDAFIDIEGSRKNFRKIFDVIGEGYIPVIPGFIAGKNGLRITLGRGGSDYSAVAAGVLSKAKLVLIMSDVEGIYTADPKLVPNARLIPYISYDEVILASRHGMKAIQWKAAELAKRERLPVLFGRTRNWRMATVLGEKSSKMPLMTYGDGLLLINTPERLPYPVIDEGEFWTLYDVPQEDAVRIIRELHKKLFPPVMSLFQHVLYKDEEIGHNSTNIIEKMSTEQTISRKIYYEEGEVEPLG